jgi:hypothetical protein
MRNLFANSRTGTRTRVNTIYCCALARQTDRRPTVQYGNSFLFTFKNGGWFFPSLDFLEHGNVAPRTRSAHDSEALEKPQQLPPIKIVFVAAVRLLDGRFSCTSLQFKLIKRCPGESVDMSSLAPYDNEDKNNPLVQPSSQSNRNRE